MNLNDLFPESEYLKSEDVEEAGGEMVLTVREVGRKEFERENGQKDVKGVLAFVEVPKKLTCNTTNLKIMGSMFGNESIDTKWIGKEIALYVDYHVQYAGKEVKGIRIRLVDEKQDAVQTFWKKARELGYSRDEGLKILAKHNQNFKAALLEINTPAPAGDMPF